MKTMMRTVGGLNCSDLQEKTEKSRKALSALQEDARECLLALLQFIHAQDLSELSAIRLILPEDAYSKRSQHIELTCVFKMPIVEFPNAEMNNWYDLSVWSRSSIDNAIGEIEDEKLYGHSYLSKHHAKINRPKDSTVAAIDTIYAKFVEVAPYIDGYLGRNVYVHIDLETNRYYWKKID